MIWPAVVGGIASIAGGLLSNNASKRAAAGMQYRPWSTNLQGLGGANFANGQLNLTPDAQAQSLNNLLSTMGLGQLGGFSQGQESALGQDFLRGEYNLANTNSGLGLEGLLGSMGFGGYQGQDMMQGLNAGMLNNFDPNQAASSYTNLLRQQAMPQEQQAASSALTQLFNTGRLGSTGGMNAYQGLMDSQNQADIGRQVAGQQFGLNQQLMAQQGYDAARANQQGLMLNNFGAGQQGLMNAFGINQGLYGRQSDLYTASNSATQDRFMRAMQLFGGENAQNQQFLQNFQGLLGAQQSQNQQLMDLGRIGASVGQAQTTAGANAAMMRNQGTQDMIAGFLGGINRIGSIWDKDE
jgi:hypothetical protein